MLDLSRALPQSFSRVPALETLIPSQAGYPKYRQEDLRHFPLQLFPFLGAGWLQKAGARLRDIDGFPALRSLLLPCGGKRPSPAAEGELLMTVCSLFPALRGEQGSRVFTLDRPALLFP